VSVPRRFAPIDQGRSGLRDAYGRRQGT
jgi:hypothetical protein